MNLLDQLIDTYLVSDMDEAYYDVIEKAIVYDREDDAENIERFELIPTITTAESFRLMEQFAESALG